MTQISPAARWTGRALSTLAVLFLIFDTAIKVFLAQSAVDATMALGFTAGSIRPLGVLELVCLILYVIPRTAPFGAVLFTGWLGGALASHLRHGDPLFSHILFPTYIGILLWVGLALRDPRVRAVFAARTPQATA